MISFDVYIIAQLPTKNQLLDAIFLTFFIKIFKHWIPYLLNVTKWEQIKKIKRNEKNKD